jgi:hypothetical protein
VAENAATETESDNKLDLLRDLAALALLLAFFTAWYAPAIIGGSIWVDEDTFAYFYSNRARLYAIAHGVGFSWWDPLPGLGQPRLANLQNGIFSPLSTLFYWLPPAQAFRFYPVLALSLLSMFCFALLRVTGLARMSALLGALAFPLMSGVATHLQHPAALDTLIWWPAVLLAWELFRRTGKARYVLAAGVALSFVCFGGFPQYIFYSAFVGSAWMGAGLWADRPNRDKLLNSLVAIAAIAWIGASLASWQLLPAIEMLQQSHRSLLSDTGTFGDLYRAARLEVPLALASEAYLVIDAPPLAHGAPYLNRPQLSVLITALACFALWRDRRLWPLGAIACLCLLGMLGSAGGVMPLLGQVMPFIDRLRVPLRMIVPAGFLLSMLAAHGLDILLKERFARADSRAAVAALAIVWITLLAWTLRRPDDRYASPELFSIPPVVAGATPLLIVDPTNSGRATKRGVRSVDDFVPLYNINAGLSAGVATLLLRDPLIPRNFFEAYFASQFGSLAQHSRVDEVIRAVTLPLRNPGAPLLRAFGLRSIVRHAPYGLILEERSDALPRFAIVPAVTVLEDDERRWARFSDLGWDPAREAISSDHRPEFAALELEAGNTKSVHASVEVIRDEPDFQELKVESSGGVLLTQGLFFPGWRVWVDGEEATPIEIDGALRSVVLSAGAHRVEWRYRPPWLGSACLATASGFVCALLVVWRGCPSSLSETR